MVHHKEIVSEPETITMETLEVVVEEEEEGIVVEEAEGGSITTLEIEEDSTDKMVVDLTTTIGRMEVALIEGIGRIMAGEIGIITSIAIIILIEMMVLTMTGGMDLAASGMATTGLGRTKEVPTHRALQTETCLHTPR